MPITNNSGIPLALAVWLVHDEYDFVKDDQYISVTGLMKPLRQIVLTPRVAPEHFVLDVADLIPSAMGKSLHDTIEKAWVTAYRTNLRKLGFTPDVIDRVMINPTDEELKAAKHPIPIYLEQREIRTLNGWKIGGKFDMVAEGIVHDNKSTSAYSWVYNDKDGDYALQGSLYRWLNPVKITEDFIRINFIFTDWQRAMAKSNPNYPQLRCIGKEIPLLSLEDTEKWAVNKLKLIEQYFDAPEKDIPECTSDELWMSEPTYKYYANPEKTDGRSTKNFDSIHAAKAFMAEKGGKGVIKTIAATPKRCEYCPAFPACSQKDKYFVKKD